MTLEIFQDDPLGVLTSTKSVVEKAQFVSMSEGKLEELGNAVIKKFNRGLDRQELGFGSTGNLSNDAQLIFMQNVVNFCFWPDRGKPKSEIEWPAGTIVSGGWFGLVACFERALAEKIPILDARYLSKITAEDARHFFRSKNGVEIPLLQERIENLREAGKVLQEKFGGAFINLVEANDYDAVKIAHAIMESFTSFRDISMLNGKEVRFLKRAQICPNDLVYVLEKTSQKITNLEKLTAYADYKLPQVLRAFGILEYENTLAEKVDTSIAIPHDSREEIEIRATTIWAVELLRQKIGTLTAGEIDNTIWLISQSMSGTEKPYHRTRTIYY